MQKVSTRILPHTLSMRHPSSRGLNAFSCDQIPFHHLASSCTTNTKIAFPSSTFRRTTTQSLQLLFHRRRSGWLSHKPRSEGWKRVETPTNLHRETMTVRTRYVLKASSPLPRLNMSHNVGQLTLDGGELHRRIGQARQETRACAGLCPSSLRK